ncbi:MAG: histidine phosphatase family protein [Phycisphaerae bacterium]
MAERIGRSRATAVYSSPYRRALKTALPVAARLGMPIWPRAELCEFQGNSRLDLTGFSPRRWTPRLRTARNGAEPGTPDGEPSPANSETLAECIARQRRRSRLRAWAGENDIVVLIGHGLPVARFVEAWLTDTPGPAFRFLIENAAVSCLRSAGGVASLVALNDSGHLAGLPPARGSFLRGDGAFEAAPPREYW